MLLQSVLASFSIHRLALYAVALSIFIWLPAHAIDNGQKPGSMAHDLLLLEKEHGIDNSGDKSVFTRLQLLEIEVFGSTKVGSLVERIQAIKNATIERKATDSSADSQNSNLDLKIDEPVTKYIARLNNALPYTNTSPVRFYRITPVASASSARRVSSDYLNTILKATKNKVLRFDKMPIPVFITPLRNKLYTNSCIKGFEAWEARTNGRIRFVQVADINQARIRVKWNKLGLKKDSDDCALGAHTVTKWKKRGKGKLAVMSVGAIPLPLYIPRFGPKYSVPPQVIEVNLDLIDSKRQDIKFLVLKNIVTHELGHALGILGHSSNREDMMYPVTDQHSRISNRDLNTLSKLYNMKVDIPL